MYISVKACDFFLLVEEGERNIETASQIIYFVVFNLKSSLNPYKPYHIWCPHKHKTMPIKRFNKFRGATDTKVEMFGK